MKKNSNQNQIASNVLFQSVPLNCSPLGNKRAQSLLLKELLEGVDEDLPLFGTRAVAVSGADSQTRPPEDAASVSQGSTGRDADQEMQLASADDEGSSGEAASAQERSLSESSESALNLHLAEPLRATDHESSLIDTQAVAGSGASSQDTTQRVAASVSWASKAGYAAEVLFGLGLIAGSGILYLASPDKFFAFMALAPSPVLPIVGFVVIGAIGAALLYHALAGAGYLSTESNQVSTSGGEPVQA